MVCTASPPHMCFCGLLALLAKMTLDKWVHTRKQTLFCFQGVLVGLFACNFPKLLRTRPPISLQTCRCKENYIYMYRYIERDTDGSIAMLPFGSLLGCFFPVSFLSHPLQSPSWAFLHFGYAFCKTCLFPVPVLCFLCPPPF